MAAWFARQGFETLGVDFAPPVVRRARAAYADVPGLAFRMVDVVQTRIPGGPYRILVDRGCFHGIPDSDRAAYAANIGAIAAPGAFFFLYMRAFRGSFDGSAAEEQQAVVAMVREVFAHDFRLKRWKRCDIGLGVDSNASRVLPGMFFLLRRFPVS